MGAPAVNDGGVAYPQPHRDLHQGLTVRDVFACHMAAALVVGTKLHASELADEAYAYADAMIRRRLDDYATVAAASLGLPPPVAKAKAINEEPSLPLPLLFDGEEDGELVFENTDG